MITNNLLEGKNLIKRTVLAEIIGHLNKKEMTLLIGARQVGKTTLMKLVQNHLEKKGLKTVFLNLDFEQDKKYFESQAKLIDKLKLEFGDKQGYVFIDEIQRKENAGLFLKGIFDYGLPYKLIVSGSGSLELKEKIHESLTGRKREIEIPPISFMEFLNYKTVYRYEGKEASFFEIEREKTELLFEEYLQFGGYPRVILESTSEEKIKIINEIYSSYVEKDISYLLRVEKIDAFTNFIKILAGQIGRLINFSELANTLDLSLPTLKNFFWYAEKTFIIKLVSPFFTNKRKEIVKSPTAYFCDFGLRNFAAGLTTDAINQNEIGWLFQNFVYNIISQKYPQQGGRINFWRSKEGAEVDLIISIGKQIIPIEVKYKNYKKTEIGQSTLSYIKKYKPKIFYIINKNLNETKKIDDCRVIFISWSNFYTQTNFII